MVAEWEVKLLGLRSISNGRNKHPPSDIGFWVRLCTIPCFPLKRTSKSSHRTVTWIPLRGGLLHYASLRAREYKHRSPANTTSYTILGNHIQSFLVHQWWGGKSGVEDILTFIIPRKSNIIILPAFGWVMLSVYCWEWFHWISGRNLPHGVAGVPGIRQVVGRPRVWDRPLRKLWPSHGYHHNHLLMRT